MSQLSLVPQHVSLHQMTEVNFKGSIWVNENKAWVWRTRLTVLHQDDGLSGCVGRLLKKTKCTKFYQSKQS